MTAITATRPTVVVPPVRLCRQADQQLTVRVDPPNARGYGLSIADATQLRDDLDAVLTAARLTSMSRHPSRSG